tara:strand:+ start:265 stop:465 length:201 start_codon:yes stop_codon:yes gene_type:complete
MLEDDGIVEHLDELNRLTDEVYSDDDTNYFLILVQAFIGVLIAPVVMIGLGYFFWMTVLSALLSLL